MIECDRCKEWFHGRCVGVEEDAAESDEAPRPTSAVSLSNVNTQSYDEPVHWTTETTCPATLNVNIQNNNLLEERTSSELVNALQAVGEVLPEQVTRGASGDKAARREISKTEDSEDV
eukprot:751750-Hanusia_phi.AAC.3